MDFNDWWKQYVRTTLMDKVSQYDMASNAFHGGFVSGKVDGIAGQKASFDNGYETGSKERATAARKEGYGQGYEQGHAMGVGVGYVGGSRDAEAKELSNRKASYEHGLRDSPGHGAIELSKARQEGYERGHTEGHDNGFAKGHAVGHGIGLQAGGYNVARMAGHTEGYKTGFDAAKKTFLVDLTKPATPPSYALRISEVKKQAHAEGHAEGDSEARKSVNAHCAQARAFGFDEGYAKGVGIQNEFLRNKAHAEGYNDGRAQGLREGEGRISGERANARATGYNEGRAEGKRISPDIKERLNQARAEGHDTGYENGHKAGYALGNQDGMGEMGEHITEELRIAIEDRKNK